MTLFNANLWHRYAGKFVRKTDRVLPNPDAKYTNLYIKNLDPDVTEEALREKFFEFGKIASLVISKDENGMSRGFGFVNFESPEDAKRALEALNGLQLGRLYFCQCKLSSMHQLLNLKHFMSLVIPSRFEGSVCSKGTEESRT